jgi:ATP phosphoribosyltransferase
MQPSSDTVTIELSKGRPLKETLPLFAAAGIEPLEDVHTSRKLIFETNRPDVRMIIIRSADVPTYVEYGVADLGVTGKDVLIEHGAEEMYELLDLNVSCCKLMTAKIKGSQLPAGKIKVASKFINVARHYFANQGRQVELIKLHGGMELAPIMDLADVIVDIVDTGNTLRANGLETDEFIADISARVIASRLALKMKDEKIKPIIEMLTNAVSNNRNS